MACPINENRSLIDKYNRLLSIGFISRWKSILIMRVLLIVSIFIGLLMCFIVQPVRSLHNRPFMSQARRTRHFARSSFPCLALRTRFALRANCRVRLAWLIKRLLCRLAWTLKTGESDRISISVSIQSISRNVVRARCPRITDFNWSDFSKTVFKERQVMLQRRPWRLQTDQIIKFSCLTFIKVVNILLFPASSRYSSVCTVCIRSLHGLRFNMTERQLWVHC